MKVRNYEDKEVVFFGSKGISVVVAENQLIDITNGATLTKSTCKNQRFKIQQISGEIQPVEIELYNDNDLISSFILNGEYISILSNPINNVVVNNTNNVPINLYLYKYQLSDKADTFLDSQNGVATALTQQLSIIKGELWYKMSFGLPLYDKISKKIEMDIAILQIINDYEDVREILKFDSYINGHTYNCTAEIQSIYGPLTISI